VLFSDKRVLVTGAGGILGYSVLSLMSKLFPKTVPVTRSRGLSAWYPKELKKVCVHMDLTDYRGVAKFIATFKPNLIFHLAANNNNQAPACGVLDIARDGLLSGLSVLEGVRIGFPEAKVIIASSVEVNQVGFFRSEKVTPYRAAKKSVEVFACAYSDSYDIDVRVLRLPNIYGAGDRNCGRFLPSLISKMSAGEHFMPEKLKNSRPFVHGLDAAGMLARLAFQENKVDTPQCADHFLKKLSFEALAGIIESLLLEDQISYSTLRTELENRFTESYYFGDKEPQLITVSEGLREMIAWYRTFGASTMVS
jgi:nucleoside-diphosphate-sugar epimerase